MEYSALSHSELLAEQARLDATYTEYAARGLNLDLTRGKPSSAQLDLSASLLTAVTNADCLSAGVDTRNYGGLTGLMELRDIFAPLFGVPVEQFLAQGNSSMQLTHACLMFAQLHGLPGSSPWGHEPRKFLCPTPGYDRHFVLSESLGFELVPVGMDEEGPLLAEVAELTRADPAVKGMWIVPQYSNPSGINVSAQRARDLLALDTAAADFTIMWDNAYALHHLNENQSPVLDVLDLARTGGHPNRVFVFGSTSKITHAGAGVAFIGSSPENIEWFLRHTGEGMIGPDKINQLRHARFFSNSEGVRAHMAKHAQLLSPKFAAVNRIFHDRLAGLQIADWTEPDGGYFIMLTTISGLATAVVADAEKLGVKLTQAGATHPYGKDPEQAVLRIAPSMPELAQVEQAAEVVALCVRRQAIKQFLAQNSEKTW